MLNEANSRSSSPVDMTMAAGAKAGGSRRWLRRGAAIGLVAVAAVTAAVAVDAQVGPRPGEGPGGHGEAPGMAMFGGPPGHMAKMMDRMLDGLGLSDAQRGQIRQIAMAAAADLKAQHEAGRDLHVRAAAIFTAPTVDASAAESLRQQMLTQQDQSSKRILQAMLDVSRVLTPEQRARLGERMRDRQAVMQDRMQRMHQGHEMPTHPKQ